MSMIKIELNDPIYVPTGKLYASSPACSFLLYYDKESSGGAFVGVYISVSINTSSCQKWPAKYPSLFALQYTKRFFPS